MMDWTGLGPKTSLSSNLKNQNEIVKLNPNQIWNKFPMPGPKSGALRLAGPPQAGQARILSAWPYFAAVLKKNSALSRVAL